MIKWIISIIVIVIPLFGTNQDIESSDKSLAIGVDDGISIRKIFSDSYGVDFSVRYTITTTKSDFRTPKNLASWVFTPGILYKIDSNKHFVLNLRCRFSYSAEYYTNNIRHPLNNDNTDYQIKYSTYSISFGPEFEFIIPQQTSVRVGFSYLPIIKYTHNKIIDVYYVLNSEGIYELEKKPVSYLESYIRTTDLDALILSLRYYF